MWDQLGSCPWQRITSCQRGAPWFLISLASSPCVWSHVALSVTLLPSSWFPPYAKGLILPAPALALAQMQCDVNQAYSCSGIFSLGTWILLVLCAECFSFRLKPCSVNFQLHSSKPRNCLYSCATQLCAFCCWTFGPVSSFQTILLYLLRIAFWRWTYYSLLSDTG